jgi:hypothetical protein
VKKLLVLSGTAAEARDFCNECGIPLSSIVYVSHAQQTRGLTSPSFVVCGTFWDRHDASEVWTSLQICFLGTGTQTFPTFMTVAAAQVGKPKATTPRKKKQWAPLNEDGDFDGPTVPADFGDHKTFKKIRTT